MLYNTQNYWVLGLCPSPGILETRKHNVSENGSVSVLRRRGEKTPTQLSSTEKANISHWRGLTNNKFCWVAGSSPDEVDSFN
jgi:hypothetical protein